MPYLHWKCADDGLLGAGNALVFGHHLDDGTMFSALHRSRAPVTRKGHSPILLRTPEGDARLRVLAVDVVDASREGAKVEFADDAEHAQWLARVVADADLSLVGEGFDCSSVKSVVTLCTCSYNRWGNEHTLVICAIERSGDAGAGAFGADARPSHEARRACDVNHGSLHGKGEIDGKRQGKSRRRGRSEARRGAQANHGPLKKGVRGVFESARYRRYLAVMSRFHSYSANNCLLIAMQPQTRRW